MIHLRVQNLGVLEDASMDPGPGLTVITGETGAGKTLLVGGLRLILGERPDPLAVGPHGDQAQADGLFETGESEVGVTRVVPREGRSRCLLDGSVVSTDTVANRVGDLVEIVAQHDQLSLRRPSRVLELVDACLDDAGRDARETYRTAWERWRDVEGRRAALGGDPTAMARELDLLQHQLNEIEAARLRPGDDEALEIEASRLRNIEEISEHLSESARLAERLADDGGEVVSRLRKVSSLDPGTVAVAESAEGAAAAIAELASALRAAIEGLDVDPSRQEEVEARLTAIGDLKRKYGRTLEEVLDYGREAARRAEELLSLTSDVDRIEELAAQAQRELGQAAGDLRQARRRATEQLVAGAGKHLEALAMKGASLEVRLDEVEPGTEGADRAELWFASDARLEPAPIATAASGGELSRLVLAIWLATHQGGSTTLVFDEVDAGVGGATALALGRRLGELSRGTQVLCVTHLAQVAAQADTHYAIARDGAKATLRRVIDDDRLAELARMVAGSEESQAAKRTAEELLREAGG